MEGLNEIFGFVKGDVESLEGDAVSIEVKDSNRPDIWSVEGIARVLRRQLGVGRNTDVKVTVLAWGLGIDRLYMMNRKIEDIRRLFTPDLEWIREQTVS